MEKKWKGKKSFPELGKIFHVCEVFPHGLRLLAVVFVYIKTCIRISLTGTSTNTCFLEFNMKVIVGSTAYIRIMSSSRLEKWEKLF